MKSLSIKEITDTLKRLVYVPGVKQKIQIQIGFDAMHVGQLGITKIDLVSGQVIVYIDPCKDQDGGPVE